MSVRFRCCSLLVLLFFISKASFSQSVYGTIRGALTLPTGQPVPQALVMVSSLDKGGLLKFSAVTNASGYFIFSNLPLGYYSLQTHKNGFKTHDEPVVPVAADSPSEVNVKLTEGDPADEEKGDGSAISILKLDRADVATSFSLREIDSLPIFLQNVSLFELLVPGAVPTHNVLAPQQNPQNGVYASLSGQHFSGTTVILDGTVNRDPLQGIVVLNPSLDSVAELKITTQNYSAEFGPATGGVVNIQTRSGTNQLHGSAFGYRVSGFGEAATPNFGQTSFLLGSSQKRNDFGGALGGAPIRDRFFLFGDYRAIRQSTSGTVLLTVPTQTVHDTCTGIGSDPNCDLTAYVNAGANCNTPCAEYSVPNDPNPHYGIQNGYVSPQMVNFLKLIPSPNYGGPEAPTNNFTASGVDAYRDDDFDGRADYVLSNRLRMFTRYSFADFRENGTPAFGVAGGPGTNPAQFAGVMKDRNQGISTGFSMTLNPHLLTDFRFGFFRYNLRVDSLDSGSTPASSAGIVNLNLGDSYTSGMPDFELDNPSIAGLPIAGGLDFLRLGYSPDGNNCNCPLREREQQFQFVNNWTRLFGKHDLRWGADFRYLQNFRLSSDSRPAGHLEFQNSASSATGFSLGDFLIGSVAFFARSYANPGNPAALDAGERQDRLFFYGEDSWRITSRLTLNYGLRWEIYLPQSVTAPEAGGWLQLGSNVKPFLDEYVVAGVDGSNRQGGVETTLKNFGPRFGLTYLLNPKTVIRAGYGRMFDPGYAGTIFGIAATQSPPVSVVATSSGFLVNSTQPGLPPSICTSGTCTVPLFVFPTTTPFTFQDLFCDNADKSAVNNGYCPMGTKTVTVQQQANLYALPRRLRLPTVDAWNVAVQEALDRHTYFEISYVANKGTHVLNDSTGGNPQVPYYNLNQATLAGYIGLAKTPATNCRDASDINMDHYTYCKTLQSTRTPFAPSTAQVRYFGNDASSSYNSLQVRVRHQFSSGFSLLANYTWSKIIDFDNLYYSTDPAIDRGVGNFDRKHNFVMTNIWDLPVGRGRTLWGDAGPILNRVVGGWSLAAITSWSSGLPFTPSYMGVECSADIDANNFRACRPNLVGSVHITGNRSQYFTTTGGQNLQANCVISNAVQECTSDINAALQGFNPTNQPAENQTGEVFQPGQSIPGVPSGPWQRPGAGQIGNVGRNPLRGPGFYQSDLAVAKNIPITERVAVQFRADAFNFFNRVNLANPDTDVDTASGGTITSLTAGAIPRRMQFSLRVTF